MLKRQRPVSPTPSWAEIPQCTPEDVLDIPQHSPKRRRTVPPMLDGPSRGWSASGEDEDDGESDDEDYGVPQTYDAIHDAVGAYKSTNSFLHDLHAEHQHRLMFSSSSLPSFSRFSSRPSPLRHAIYSESMPDYKSPPHLSERLRKTLEGESEHTEKQVPHISENEVQRVTEEYENQNRLLGSLFLSRRRELLGDHSDS